MGKCIVSISNKMQRYTVYLYLETALQSWGGTSTHHQERIQLYLQHLVFSQHRYCHLPLSWKCWNRFECAVGGICRALEEYLNLHNKHKKCVAKKSL
jgi:hypothetical protein